MVVDVDVGDVGTTCVRSGIEFSADSRFLGLCLK